jgi:hypothetical protein
MENGDTTTTILSEDDHDDNLQALWKHTSPLGKAAYVGVGLLILYMAIDLLRSIMREQKESYTHRPITSIHKPDLPLPLRTEGHTMPQPPHPVSQQPPPQMQPAPEPVQQPAAPPASSPGLSEPSPAFGVMQAAEPPAHQVSEQAASQAHPVQAIAEAGQQFVPTLPATGQKQPSALPFKQSGVPVRQTAFSARRATLPVRKAALPVQRVSLPIKRPVRPVVATRPLSLSPDLLAPEPATTTAGSADMPPLNDRNEVDPSWWPCHEGQIKGNRDSKKYHVPGGRFYARTYEGIDCFDTEEQARAAGYERSKR